MSDEIIIKQFYSLFGRQRHLCVNEVYMVDKNCWPSKSATIYKFSIKLDKSREEGDF